MRLSPPATARVSIMSATEPSTAAAPPRPTPMRARALEPSTTVPGCMRTSEGHIGGFASEHRPVSTLRHARQLRFTTWRWDLAKRCRHHSHHFPSASSSIPRRRRAAPHRPLRPNRKIPPLLRVASPARRRRFDERGWRSTGTGPAGLWPTSPSQAAMNLSSNALVPISAASRPANAPGNCAAGQRRPLQGDAAGLAPPRTLHSARAGSECDRLASAAIAPVLVAPNESDKSTPPRRVTSAGLQPSAAIRIARTARRPCEAPNPRLDADLAGRHFFRTVYSATLCRLKIDKRRRLHWSGIHAHCAQMFLAASAVCSRQRHPSAQALRRR